MKKRRDPLDTIYIVEAKGVLDSQWGYYTDAFRTQREAREDIRRRKTLQWPCESYRLVRYRRAGVVGQGRAIS